MLNDEQKACCAHLRVKAAPRENGDGTMSDWWECFDCRQRFIPVAPTEVGTIHGCNSDGSLICEAESGEYAIRYADINCPDCLRDLDARPAAPEVPPAEPDNVIRDPSIGCCVDEGVCAHAERDVVGEKRCASCGYPIEEVCGNCPAPCKEDVITAMAEAGVNAIRSGKEWKSANQWTKDQFRMAMSAAREVAVKEIRAEVIKRTNELGDALAEITSLKEQLRAQTRELDLAKIDLQNAYGSNADLQEQLRQSVTQRDQRWEKAIEETRGTCVDWDGFMQGIRARLTTKPAEPTMQEKIKKILSRRDCVPVNCEAEYWDKLGTEIIDALKEDGK